MVWSSVANTTAAGSSSGLGTIDRPPRLDLAYHAHVALLRHT
jgi:hypothetical protein